MVSLTLMRQRDPFGLQPGIAVRGEAGVCVYWGGGECQGIGSNQAPTARFNSYNSTVAANHQFNVQAPQKAAQVGWDYSYGRMPPTKHGSCPVTPPRSNNTLLACTCALPLPTAHPHASLAGGGGWGLALQPTDGN